ncbi:MAG TPA: two pore domain potassium channel family protein [Verrucomicrobiae bacterium]|nr:two pore domain potassium channel family protein [Verrucomicrobiae bacterium]
MLRFRLKMSGWNAWDSSTLWSLALIALTIMIHAVGVVLIVLTLERFRARLAPVGRLLLVSSLVAIGLIVGVAVTLVVLHGIECVAWAIVYVKLGALPSPADALLYSVDSMTTRGSAGLYLERQWRMMGALESGDGMLLFGVSTASLFYLMQRLWKSEAL